MSMSGSEDDSGVRMSIPYNPSVKAVGESFGTGVLLGVLHLFPVFRSRLWLFVAIGFILFSVLILLRRLVWKRVLIVRDDALIVPTGFLRLRRARLAFADIRRVSFGQLFQIVVLRVSTDERSVEIMDRYLPDREVLFELRRILETSLPAREP